MRLALVLVVLLAAGCVTPPSAGPGAGAGHASAGGWALDCGHANGTWKQDCAMRASKTGGPKQEIWLAVNPNDPRNVILGSKDLNPESAPNCVWSGIAVTHDAGATWNDIVLGGKYAARQPTSPYYGYACATDPMFQFTKDGAVHYGLEMYNFGGKDAFFLYNGTPLQPFTETATPGWKVLLVTSHDGGDTWPDVITYHPDLLVRNDYSRMTVNPKTQTILETIQLVQTGGATTCNVLSSRDGGKTADAPWEGKSQADPNAVCIAVAASPKGTLVLAYASDSRVAFARSVDDGKTWTDEAGGFAFKSIPQFSESKFRDSSYVELAYASDGTLYAVSAESIRDEADIYFRTSPDDGRTWSAPVMVNNDPAGAHQWMPNLAVAAVAPAHANGARPGADEPADSSSAGDGSIHVFYMDKGYDSAHKLIDLSHAVSLDGGKTWANERVTNVSFDGDLGRHQRGFPFIGDYLGVACVADDCWAGFPDSSNGVETVMAAAHVHKVST